MMWLGKASYRLMLKSEPLQAHIGCVNQPWDRG